MSSCVRWYFFSYIGRIGFRSSALGCDAARCAAMVASTDDDFLGVPAAAAASASRCSFRRGSDGGRNFGGV